MFQAYAPDPYEITDLMIASAKGLGSSRDSSTNPENAVLVTQMVIDVGR